jgi:Putative glycosyl/glycerophosphate transferases involved in teichoic acid biosynthesis TagF/TagB/EpsJ/RodC
MEPYIQINEIEINHNVLQLHLTGQLKSCQQMEKIRIILLFSQKEENRRIPMDVTYNRENSLECMIEGKAQIMLPHVFYREMNFDSCRMSIILQYGYQELTEVPFVVQTDQIKDGIKVEPNCFILDSIFFAIQKKTRSGILYRMYQIISLLVCILISPVLFTIGMKKNKNVKGALRFVSVKTGNISGISYSKREWKTKYFKACYERSLDKHIAENRIVFLSERKLDQAGNLVRVMEQVQSNQQVEVILMQKEKTVSSLSFAELKEIASSIATARIIVLDDFYPQLHALTIREETSVIQLWHACGAFKTFGFTRIGKPGGAAQDSPNHRSYDYAFVSSEQIRGIYSEAFGISKENVLALGVPRTDDFFSESYQFAVRKKLYQKYPVLLNKKVVLLAPTFRGDGNKDAFYPVDQLPLDQICEAMPEEYLFVIKNHPFVKNHLICKESNQNRILDLSTKENINELLFVTDVLVTDYSSVVFEATMLDLPMVFYAFDLEEYMANRDVYFDYEKFVPGPIVYDWEQLCKSIVEVKAEPDKNQFFKEYFLDALDGKSTERISEFIIKQVTT